MFTHFFLIHQVVHSPSEIIKSKDFPFTHSLHHPGTSKRESEYGDAIQMMPFIMYKPMSVLLAASWNLGLGKLQAKQRPSTSQEEAPQCELQLS